MQGVLGQGRRGSYLHNRFKSPQPEMTNFINLPSFEADRGRRKISKMGGLQMMFSRENSNDSPVKARIVNHPRDRDVRRLSNFFYIYF